MRATTRERVAVRFHAGGLPQLFFPDRPAAFGHIECWCPVDGHADACRAFYLECQPVSEAEALPFLKRYAAAYNVPGGVEGLRFVRRISAWGKVGRVDQ